MKKKENNKSFGILFFIIFLLVAFWPLIHSEFIRLWALGIASIFLVLGITNSKILTPVKKSWIKFGEILGLIIAPMVMALVYFIFLTPISLILRLFGKDLLGIKVNKKIDSYWIKRKKNIGPMRKQF